MMSPTYFAVRNARLDKEFEAARLAGDLRRMQGLLAEKTILLRRMYGWPPMTTAAFEMSRFMILLLRGDRFCPRTASTAATSSRQSPYSERRREAQEKSRRSDHGLPRTGLRPAVRHARSRRWSACGQSSTTSSQPPRATMRPCQVTTLAKANTGISA
jgi:hypothetical protein